MRIIGKDGKDYASEKECIEADKKYEEELKAKKDNELKKVEAEKNAVATKKKEKAQAVEDARKKCAEATKLYQVAKKKAEDILREANKKAEEVLKEAAAKVEKASEERMNAVIDFNKEFGPYRTVLTGNDAIDAFNNDFFVDSLLPYWARSIFGL